MGKIISHPYWAPALVDNTRCEVPIAMLANNRPGPKLLMKRTALDKLASALGANLHKNRCGKKCYFWLAIDKHYTLLLAGVVAVLSDGGLKKYRNAVFKQNN